MISSVFRRIPLVFICAALLCVAPARADTGPLPEGWRFPAEAELAAPWRAEDPERHFVTRGDFDGDGLADRAAILFSTERSWRGVPASIALFLWPGSGEPPRALHVQEGVLPVDIERIGISTVPPGRHTTACGIGIWECAPDEPPILELEHPALLYFLHESHAAAYYWSDSHSAYRAVAMDD